jgi:hypothetical protein
MPQCQFPVFAVFVFQKSYTGNILGIGRNKSQSSYFSRHETKSEDKKEGHRRAAAPWHGVGHPLAAPWPGVGPWPTSWRRPFAYIIPSTGKPKGTNQFSTKPAASRRRRRRTSEGSRSSSRHPVGEGNHRRRPSSSPWSPPEWRVH